MKVLHIYRTCYPETKGGLEQAIRFICKGTSELGYQNTILTLGEHDKDYTYEGYRIIVIKKDFEISSNGFSFRLIKAFINLSKEHDIIHFQYPWPTGDLLSLFSPKEKKMIVSYQSDIIKQKWLKIIYTPLEYLFFNKIDKIIASSPQYAKTSKNLIKYKKKVEVIPLAIDEDSYPKDVSTKIEYWKNKIGSDFYLFVGVLRYYKGLQYLLEAANINKLPVVIAGDGPERTKLEQYIKNHKLNNVKLIGFIDEDDKVALHLLSKAFVFPSHLRSEAFGISLLEAQMHSKPIISADIGTGSSYVNKHNITGITVKPEDAKSLSNAMIKLNLNSELSKEMGINGRKRFDSLFSINRYTKSYSELYKNILY
ncbi:glycosyltransferase [Photobacterium damselae subsp. damselae]|uniref:Glycosyltransferase n=1 Tax=Photobacterium damselae subsp. damselae TaxID=85581 RepID=A0A850QYU1_PHODD|nr:glycosyltransferase [Photobacterium damselae subsp. damselae]